MQAGPAVRYAFAKELEKVRALDTEGKFKKQLSDIEFEYQCVLMQSLDRFHKEMLRANLPEKLHSIKEAMSDTTVDLLYRTNLPFSSWNWDLKRCRLCKRAALNHINGSNELCCQNCGLLEPLEGVVFDYNELYQCDDYKVPKRKRSNRGYNFKYFLDKHVKHCAKQGFILYCETVQQARKFFETIDAALPQNVSLAFVAFKIFQKIVTEDERFILEYLWAQVPESRRGRYEEKWEEMLRHYSG